MIIATTNWESVAVVIASIFTSAAIVGRWVTWAMKRADDARTADTRAIVLEALSSHMVNEETIRRDDIRRTKKWRKEIKGQISELRTQVVTLNGLTIGQLGADAETRRIEGIPHAERTRMEQEHLTRAPMRGPAQGA